MSTIHLPATAKDLLPPKQTDLNTVGRSFVRAHYDEVLPLFQPLSGERPSEHGAFDLDEAAAVFKAKEIARGNGFKVLGELPTAQFRRILRQALKTTTGVTVKALRAQDVRLRLEQKQKSEEQE